MKKLIMLCLISFISFGQNIKEQSADSKIEKVTVFLSGAQVIRTAKVFVSSGKTELHFHKITPDFDVKSIQVKSEGDVAIQSVKHEINYLDSKTKPQEIKQLEAQRDVLQDKISTEKSMLTVFKREEEMLIKNQSVAGQQTGLKTMDLKESIDFQRLRMTEVLTKQLELEKNLKKLDLEIQKINNQITQLTNSKGEETSDIVVVVLGNNPTNVNFSISYFVNDANWKPSYDLRVKDISKPLNLTFKANINQNSGEDWKDVKLSLSTGEPQKQGNAPVLNTWYLSEVQQPKAMRFQAPTIARSYPPDYQQYNPNIKEVTGVVTDENGSVIPGVSIQAVGTNSGTRTNGQGYFSLKIPNGVTMLQYSMVGYLSRQLTIFQGNMSTQLYNNTQELQEVVVTGYAANMAKDDDGFMGNLKAKTAGIDLTANTNYQQTSKSFDLPQPYTIVDATEDFQVEIKPLSIPAIYEYYVAPKYDKDAFLTAKIADWEQYDLLQGTMKLYFEDTYLGESFLNLDNKDTLNISLGRDKSVIVSRVKMNDFRKKQTLGSNKSDSRNYEITVRNTKRQAINLVIEDQFPISTNKEISIENQEAEEAEINKETGKLTWRLNLQPNVEKKLRHRFTVKSPKNMVLNLN
jgi:hypothetical protein